MSPSRGSPTSYSVKGCIPTRCGTRHYSIIKESEETFNCLISAGLSAGSLIADAGLFVCWSCDTMSAPARQAPMIHVVQLVRHSRVCSGCCKATGTSGRLSACSLAFDSASFGETLASPAGRDSRLRSNSLAARSSSSILGGSAGTPSCYFLWVFCSLVLVVSGTGSGAAGSVTLSTSSAICWFSIIVYCLRAFISKLAVLHCC